jgi:arginyl-tRNA synthetase
MGQCFGNVMQRFLCYTGVMKYELEQSIAVAIKELFAIDMGIELTRPEERFGDFATNVALQLAKQLGKSPREIGEALADKLRADERVAEVTVAGPGFLNLRLSNESLVRQLIDTSPRKTRQNQTTVIETNNPNPFKAMHIGHAFNAILGDTIANLLEADGAKLYRVSYHGDVGLHVGKSMYSLLRFVDGDASKLQTVPVEERNSFMSKMYAEGSNAYKEDETAKAEIDELTKQSFMPTSALYAEVYDTCKKWSFGQIDAVVSRLGNKPTERKFMESDADVRGVKIVHDNTPGVFQEVEGGALMFPGSEYGAFDNVYVTSRGLGLYGARDLGLMQLKKEQYHPQKSYIVTAEEQRDYFKGVIAAAAQIWPDQAATTVNISTGTVKLSTGKMSSRDGDVIEIAWLFDQFKAAITESGGQATDEMAAAAMRYQFLKVKIGSDVVFDINEAVSLQGNTGSYLQYAHARARSILAKAEGDLENLGAVELEPEERTLVRKMTEYADVTSRATAELLPHHICNYLYELSQEFNRFYENNRVIGDARECVRLSLVTHYADTLKAGLTLLGIHAPERM